MANQVYENTFLSNEIEDQFNSHLDLMQFVTVDTSLQGTAGMKIAVNRYSATDGTQKLKMGEGNTRQVEVRLTQEEREIELAQNRFKYYDEEAMKDPTIVLVGSRHLGTDMFNTVNSDIYEEFRKTPVTLAVERFDFDAFVDAGAAMNLENLENVFKFAFVCPLDVASIRKNLKDTLQYVKEFATSGYVGTVGDINIYTKKDAVKGEVIVATKEAVVVHVKTGTEVEQSTKGNRDDEQTNKRENSVYSRKYYVVALEDESKCIKLTCGKDTSLSELKVGELALVPDFEPGIYSYAVTTTNASDTITVKAKDGNATATIKNGSKVVASGSAATWESGKNSVTIEVVNGTDKSVYKIEVTKN